MSVSGPVRPELSPKPLGPKGAVQAILWCPDGKKEDHSWNWAAPISGKTRLVKELFLLEQETRSGKSGVLSFKFTPGPYGPSSLELTDCLDELVRSGEVATSPLRTGRGVRLQLGPSLGGTARVEWKGLSDQVRADFYRVKSRVAQMTYKQFMIYVYRTYPEYLEKSLIRDEVLPEDDE